MIRVLVVDDSSFMRMRIRNHLEEDSKIKVAGIARNGKEAIDKVELLKPDVITMDITMPVMEGIEAVPIIMKSNPTPIIMVSSLTQSSTYMAVKCLELGAFDCIGKTELTGEALIQKVHTAYSSLNKELDSEELIKKTDVKKANFKKVDIRKVATEQPNEVPVKIFPSSEISSIDIIGIAVSTGGPKALGQMIPKINKDIKVPILIAQHMPPVFTKSLAQHLDNASQIKVIEAKDGQYIEPGVAYICPGGMNMKVDRRGTVKLIKKEELNYIYVPSGDLLLSTIADIYGSNSLSIVMTGMGQDGANGAEKIKQAGGYVIAQSKATCIIYGMPKAVVDRKLYNEIVDLDKIANKINSLTKKSHS